ncbi:polysaccharide biosynthesis tyrosine autokinase [Winogradskyella sp.]|nr:polysaccharide biosynthesis tyrosine autokinase [Winogradskyella sp.]
MAKVSQKSYKNAHNKGHLIKKELAKYLRLWPFIFGSILIAIAIVFVQLRYTKSQYKSFSKIKILSNTKGLELPQAGFIFSRPNINLENNIEIIKSSRLWEELVVNLELVTSFLQYGNVLLTEVETLPFNYKLDIPLDEISDTQKFKIDVRNDGLFVFKNEMLEPIVFSDYSTLGKDHDLPFTLSPLSFESIKANIGTVYEIQISPVKTTADRLRQKFNVTVVGKNSELLELSMEGELKSKSERILNGLMEVFELDGIRLRQTISERTINFIQERFTVLANELDSIESGIKDYKVTNNMLSIESKATADLTKLSLSEQELVTVEAQFLVLDFIKKTIELPLESLEILPNFINDDGVNINAEIKAYNALVFEMDRLKTNAKANNPVFIELQAELESLKNNLKVSLALFRLQLTTTKNELTEKNTAYNASLLEIPSMEMYMRNIERQQQIKETLYLFLLQKREEAAINKAITEPTMQVVEYASSWWDPVFPNPKNLYGMALLLGLAIPIAIIYLILLLDTKLKSIDDIKSIVDGLPVLGEIPFVKDNSALILEKNDNSPFSEAYRILSSNLSFVLPLKTNKEAQIILSTSTIKGEGKTFTSINIAVALASLGKRVLLLGGDLRNPQIHKTIGTLKNNDGLSTYLHNRDMSWKALINPITTFDNLDIITSGPIPPNAPQLLNNGRLESLLTEAKHEYDFVIIDSAPTLLVSDTMLISPLADLTLFVTRYGYTDKELLNFVKDMNETGKITNLAFVFNGVKSAKSYGYKYGYKYGYNYGYNYGYGNKN